MMEAAGFTVPAKHRLNLQGPLMQPTAPREKTKRPQLSCNPCRQRKVKCDRIQPCTACSLHQIAEICQYDLTETERHPILQAEALKEKDKTIASLRNAIQRLRGQPIKSEPPDEVPFDKSSQRIKIPPRVTAKPATLRQKRSSNGTANDSIYFGSPGMTRVVEEFANLSVHRQAANLTHPVPRGTDVFSFQMTKSFPFPTMWSAQDDSSGLLKILPPEQDIFAYLDAFQRRAQSSSFPHVPEECTELEVRRFLSNLEHNAAVHLDMLALLFATLAQGLQNGVYDKCGERWVAVAMESESKKGDVWIAAAMQALRLASCLSRPTLLTIETLVMIGPYLTNSGKFLDAWAVFGLTIRLAQSIGLHRDPNRLNPPPPLKEAMVRKNLWWWMLHMDQQYSMTLGSPLGISSVGDCPAPEPLVFDPVIKDLSNYVAQFTLLARQILSTGYLNVEQIDSFTDQLLALKATLPAIIHFDHTWLDKNKAIPPWPLDAQAAVFHGNTHNFLLLLNRQRIANVQGDSNGLGADGSKRDTDDNTDFVPRGRERVLESCRALLQSFEFFSTRVRAAMICWTMGQQAFNAGMILILSMLETREAKDLDIVRRTYSIFLDMNKLGIHKLAGAAVERLGSLMKEFHAGESTGETVMGQQGMILLEDPGLQGYKEGSFTPLNFQMAGGALEKPTEAGMGENTATSAPTTPRDTHSRKGGQRKPNLGHNTRPRASATKPTPRRRRRSSPHRNPPRQLSPKKSHHKGRAIRSAGAVPPPGSLPFSYTDPDMIEPTTMSMSILPTTNPPTFSPVNVLDPAHQALPLHDLNFDPGSQHPREFPRHRPPFSHSGSDPGVQHFAYGGPHIAPSDLLDDSFHATAGQMDYDLDGGGFKQYHHPSYPYSMTEIPCSYAPPY